MSKEGLYRRKNGSWVWDVWIDGKRCIRTFDRSFSLEEAKALAGKERHDIVAGRAGFRKPKDLSFDAASDLFLEHSRANPKKHTVRYHEQTIAKLKEGFKGKPLSEITTFAVEGYRRKRARTASVRANRELAVLKAIFSRMIAWKRFAGENPVKGVKLAPEPQRRLRYLDEDEEAKLLAACSAPASSSRVRGKKTRRRSASERRSGEQLKAILILGIHCGLRIEAEAVPLLWGAVDLPKRTITVTSLDSKTHKARSIPMNSTATQAVEKLRKGLPHADGDPVFLNRRGQQLRSIRTIFEKAREKAGLGKDVGLHTMRHTFASRLVMAGESLRTVQLLGGWASLRMLERYAHLSDQHLRDAVAKLERVRDRRVVS